MAARASRQCDAGRIGAEMPAETEPRQGPHHRHFLAGVKGTLKRAPEGTDGSIASRVTVAARSADRTRFTQFAPDFPLSSGKRRVRCCPRVRSGGMERCTRVRRGEKAPGGILDRRAHADTTPIRPSIRHAGCPDQGDHRAAPRAGVVRCGTHHEHRERNRSSAPAPQTARAPFAGQPAPRMGFPARGGRCPRLRAPSAESHLPASRSVVPAARHRLGRRTLP